MRPSLRSSALLIALAFGCNRPAPQKASPTPAPAPVARAEPAPVLQAPVTAPPPPEPTVTAEVQVARVKNKPLAKTLQDMGLPIAQVNEITGALSGVFDFRKSRPGDQIRISSRGGQVEYLEYRASVVDEWYVRREGERMVAGKRAIEVEKRVEPVSVEVESSFYEALVAKGEQPGLAVDIADVLAWDVDFYRDVQKGDRVKALVEKFYTRGRLLKYGEILGVKYEGSSVGAKTYLRYVAKSGEPSYFDEKGNSAKKPFLKTPLKFSVVTSGFGTRALKLPYASYVHQHAGIDLAAAVGTPVWSVADGVVDRMKNNDLTAGNYLFVRHANGLETGYMHLSRFGEGIHVGARVKQKQVIGFSGATGMVTGPHLHYAMKRGGSFINPFSLKFPRADPLAASEMERFTEQTADIAARLANIGLAAR